MPVFMSSYAFMWFLLNLKLPCKGGADVLSSKIKQTCTSFHGINPTIENNLVDSVYDVGNCKWKEQLN